jgi:DNA helicase II / ATP-dependent DNA helicase PcrA
MSTTKYLSDPHVLLWGSISKCSKRCKHCALPSPCAQGVSVSLDPRIEEELKIFDELKLKVREAALKEINSVRPNTQSFQNLRDQARHAGDFDLPMLLDQLHIEHQLIHRDQKVQRPELAAPYFGRIILEENGKLKSYLIGEVSFLESTPAILDWKSAPLAKIFFQYKPGDEYEIELPNRTTAGLLLDKITLGFHKGVLTEIKRQDFHARLHNGEWSTPSKSLSKGFGKNRSNKTALQIKSLLDPKQYRVLSTAHDEPLLVMGSAGSGKTTIALHRLALLPKEKTQSLSSRA